MKQLVILSGKGGTGKTTVASSFIRLLNAKLYADCDVDAPNLHLLYKGDLAKETDFYGLPKATIDSSKCISCGKCQKYCKFNAIENDNGYKVEPLDCEGCGVCEIVCSVGAISLSTAKAGDLRLFTNEDKVFSTAELKMGNGTSGKLVTEVKKQLRNNAKTDGIAIIDGSPGIGCPVIATLSGADAVLIVTEPSLSGISDMERVVGTANGFGVKIFVCVNKYDTNEKNTAKIEDFCKQNNLEFVGKIPYDKEAVTLVNNGKSIVDMDCKSGKAVRKIFDKVIGYWG